MTLWLAYGIVFLAFNFVLGIVERLWLRPAFHPGEKTRD